MVKSFTNKINFMRPIYLTLISFFINSSFLFGQSILPNSNFESFSGHTPEIINNWQTSNRFVQLFGKSNVILNTDFKYSGKQSVCLKSIMHDKGGKVFPGIVSNTDFILNQSTLKMFSGTKLSSKINAISFYYMYQKRKNDYFVMRAFLLRTNSSGGIDTVAYAELNEPAESTGFKKKTVDFEYVSDEMPEFMQLYFSSSSLSNPQSGSVLYIDDIALSSLDNENPEIEILDFKYYPNPVTDVLKYHISFNQQQNFTVQLYNSIGNVVYKESFNQDEVYGIINASSFKRGVYFLEVTGMYLKEIQKVIIK